jgi:predicted RNA-binding protein YlxR (DUF448 family)
MKQRKIPMRKCVACQQNKEKKELIRIVRSPEGEVSVDLTGRKNGRGAYLCLDLACIDLAESKNILSKQLKSKVETFVFEDLKKHAEGQKGGK